jgi:hypothetical protein
MDLPWRSGAAKDWRHPNKTNPKATNFMLSETIFREHKHCSIYSEFVLDGTQKDQFNLN